MNRRNFIRALWIGAMLLVLVTALMPVPNVRDLPSHSDKLVHLLCYLVLGLLAVLSQREWRSRLLAAVAMAGFGFAVELAQGQLPWRSFEWMDIVANVTGVAIGSAIALLVPRRKPGP